MDIRLVTEGNKVYANVYLDDNLSGISKITSSDGQVQNLPQDVSNKKILYIHSASSKYTPPTLSKY